MNFKTNAKCGGCTAAITKALAPIVSADKISFDLSSPDKVMTVNADVNADAIVSAVAAAGFNAVPVDLHILP